MRDAVKAAVAGPMPYDDPAEDYETPFRTQTPGPVRREKCNTFEQSLNLSRAGVVSPRYCLKRSRLLTRSSEPSAGQLDFFATSLNSRQLAPHFTRIARA